ncbi:MAG: hypothetical protein LLG20_22830 [Acidobacteriales bacterium]|nr:hypothetical protein [Terriglobales bacterium]
MAYAKRVFSLTHLSEQWAKQEWDKEDRRVEAYRYIPIALVAAVQGWMRLAIRDLVDVGEPFASNSKDLKITKFDHDLVMAIASQRLTAGEIIAHFVSCNRIEDLISNLDAVIGYKVVPLARKVVFKNDQFVIEVDSIYDEFVATLQDTFTLRHVFAHELDPQQEVDSSTMVRRAKFCLLLISAYDRVVSEAIKSAGAGIRTQIANEGIEPSTPSGSAPAPSSNNK